MLSVVKQALNSSQEAKTRGAQAAHPARLHGQALSQKQAAPCPPYHFPSNLLPSVKQDCHPDRGFLRPLKFICEKDMKEFGFFLNKNPSNDVTKVHCAFWWCSQVIGGENWRPRDSAGNELEPVRPHSCRESACLLPRSLQ